VPKQTTPLNLLGRLARCALLALAIVLPAGCDTVALEPAARPTQPIATLFPTVALPTAAPAAPEPAPSPDSGWLAGQAGVELRRLLLDRGAAEPAIPLVIVRLDPARVALRVAYAPDQPRGLRSWFDERQPLAAINGGFFTDEYRTTALLISDGASSGASYEGFGGMLTVGADRSISIRPLRDQPYDPSEPLAQALQSFPMLVFPGGVPADLDDNGQPARRSALAIDRQGRLLLIASPSSGFTLRGLAEWLAQSDLEIDRALNLDGGSSTGLFLKDGALEETIDSFGPLPSVLLVEPA
jgi:uncharacterized protein YigE (DUF2233 family)